MMSEPPSVHAWHISELDALPSHTQTVWRSLAEILTTLQLLRPDTLAGVWMRLLLVSCGAQYAETLE